jgi:hypothetical protein
MATKSGLIASVNGYITAVITQLKLRNGFLDIINELFQTRTVQTLNPGIGFLNCQLFYKKVGNIVYLSGEISNLTSLTTAVNITIPNSQLYVKTGDDVYVSSVKQNGDAFTLYLNGSTLQTVFPSVLVPNETLFINFHYQTND